MFDGRWRTGVDRVTGPVATTMRRTGLSADQLTALGLVLGLAAAVAIATGRLGLGLALLVAAAVPDLFDGPVAKAAGTVSPRGAFFDSVADRVTDALVLGGIAWYLASTDGGHAAMLPFALLGASSLISYQRAKAESLGYDAKGGLMERAERVIALCVGLLVSALLVPILWCTLALTLATAVQRFVKVWRQAEVVRPARAPRTNRTSVEARWRRWREATGERPRRVRSTRPGRVARRERRERRGERSWRRAGTRP